MFSGSGFSVTPIGDPKPKSGAGLGTAPWTVNCGLGAITTRG
jgi:hypothetical protein